MASNGVVEHIQTVERWREVLKTSPKLVVDFFAEWCGPCKFISPVIGELAKTYAGKVNFVKVDVDELEDVAIEQGIQSMPTFRFFANGVQTDEIIGANQTKIEAAVKDFSSQEAKPTGGVEHITTKTRWEEVLKTTPKLMVDYYAEWCGPCKFIAPVIEKLSTTYAGKIKFVKLDVDELEDVAMEQGIQSMPTFRFFAKGVKKDEVIGATQGKIENALKALASL